MGKNDSAHAHSNGAATIQPRENGRQFKRLENSGFGMSYPFCGVIDGLSPGDALGGALGEGFEKEVSGSTGVEFSVPSPKEANWHVLLLGSLALSQPIYELLGQQKAFFLAHQSRTVDLLLFVLFLSLVLPGIPVLLQILARRVNQRFGLIVHAVLFTLLLTLMALPLFNQNVLSGYVLLVFSLFVCTSGTFLYFRFKSLQSFMSILSVAIVIFPIRFLFFAPVSSLFLPQTSEREAIELKSETPVVLVIFDEFPLVSLLDDTLNIDKIRYPNLAALAQSSVFYRNASSVSDNTIVGAVPAILTGRIPPKLKSMSDPFTLFELFGNSYHINAYETCTGYCPVQRNQSRLSFALRMSVLVSDTLITYGHIVLPRPFSDALPQLGDNWNNFREAEKHQQFLVKTHHRGSSNPRYWDRMNTWAAFLNGISSQKKQLSFIHLVFPHAPWFFLPDGSEYRFQSTGRWGIPGLVEANAWQGQAFEVEQAWARHLYQVGRADSMIGELVARLKQQGIYEEAMIVVVADHGSSFLQDKTRRELNAQNFAEILPVPLLMKYPGQVEGRFDDRNVETLDILPTLADVVGKPEIGPMDGFSLQKDDWIRSKKTAWRQFDNRPIREMEFEPNLMGDLVPLIAKKQELFGLGPCAILRTPFDPLIGKTPPKSVKGDFKVQIHNVGDPTALVPSGASPYPLYGHLNAATPMPPHVWLALARNDKILAITQLNQVDEQDADFLLFVPPPYTRQPQDKLYLFENANSTWQELVSEL